MDISAFLAWITWNPSREVFTIPFIQHTIVWYGVFFATGFIFGYLLVVRFLRQELDKLDHPTPKETSFFLSDRLCWLVVIGTILGARCSEVFFYDWDYYKDHLYQIIQIWKGGLSSHGAGVGILGALWLYQRRYRKTYPFLSFLGLLDMIVVPTGLAGFCIRLGNFFNQEIIGRPTEVPWAVIFLQPADGSLPQPRHPVQLYEAFAYLAIFVLLLSCRSWAMKRFRPGFLSGLFFALVFGSRFLLEFFKAPFVGAGVVSFTMQQGQYLSIPYIIGGLILLTYSMGSRKSAMAADTASKTAGETR